MENLILINWLKDGKYRIRILEKLKIKPHLPSELANLLDTNRSSISRTLNQLKKKELVIPLKSGSRTITYMISEKGIKIMDEMLS